MLQELPDESRRMCLMMNNAKTKMMVVANTPINENNVLIENVEDYGWVNINNQEIDAMKNPGRLGGMRQTPG